MNNVSFSDFKSVSRGSYIDYCLKYKGLDYFIQTTHVGLILVSIYKSKKAIMSPKEFDGAIEALEYINKVIKLLND